MPQGHTRLIVLNRSPWQGAGLTIASRQGAKAWRMEAPGLTATDGVTLAGAEITSWRQWEPRVEDCLVSRDGLIRLSLAQAAAAVLFIE